MFDIVDESKGSRFMERGSVGVDLDSRTDQSHNGSQRATDGSVMERNVSNVIVLRHWDL